jgi:hypothetical protein
VQEQIPVLDGSEFTLHDHQYTAQPYVPDPNRAVVTYTFAEPIVVDQLEIIQWPDGVTRVEGFVGDALGSLTSIGNIFGPGGGFGDGDSYVFDFDNAIPGSIFKFVITETSRADGYAVYRAFPRLADGTRITAQLVPMCDDGVDNDRDGTIDATGPDADPGCEDVDDVSERDFLLLCDDGIDNDLDGFADYIDFAGDGGISDPPGDPACKLPTWGGGEDSECQDGINNDGKFGTDWDGGVSAGQPADPDGYDPQCLNQPWKDREESGGRRCGTGYELALLIPALLWLHRRRRLIY